MKNFICLIVAVSMLIGCSEGSQRHQAPAQSTSKEKILELESAGVIPKLDRGSDIVGPDANKNGVRDDIEEYIDKNYPSVKEHAAAMQFAKAMQETLLVETSNLVSVKQTSQKISKAIHCISSTFDGGSDSTRSAQATLQIEAITTNTKERLKAYLRFNKALDGTVSTRPKGDTCE